MLLLSLQLAHGAGAAVPPNVEYDREQDRLSMAVEGGSLKGVLQQVAKQSALEVLFDDAADSTLTLTLKEVPLEEGVKRILKGSNHALRYNKNDEGKNLLIGVIVMPAGQQNSARAHPLVPQGKEAVHFAAQQKAAAAGAEQPADWSKERWQARLEQMPAELRERLEKQAAKRLAMEEKGKEREKRREEREKARQAQSGARMNAHIPEAEQLKRKEREQQYQEKMKEQLPNREQFQSK
jgi:hypothetical protein